MGSEWREVSSLGVLERLQIDASYRIEATRRLYKQEVKRLPTVLEEKRCGTPLHNKFFACGWLDVENVLLGSKCNHLMNVNVKTGACCDIALPQSPARSFFTNRTGWGRCGIHAIALNPSRTLIATGGADPSDCLVIDMKYAPKHTLVGHRDWVFGVAWVTDYHLITCSRDRSVALWNVGPGESMSVQENGMAVTRYDRDDDTQMKDLFSNRVRDVKYDLETGIAVALTEGAIRLLDPVEDLKVVKSFYLPRHRELVATAVRRDLVAAGGLNEVQLLDPRQRCVRNNVMTIESPDKLQGVRSVQFNKEILSFGTGRGSLVFYDLRWNGSSFQEVEKHQGCDSRFHLETKIINSENGWIDRNYTYERLYTEMDFRHALYAHEWDPTGSRIFACGGPLQFGLTGCYLGLWE